MKYTDLMAKKNDCINKINNGEKFDRYNPYHNYKKLWFYYLKRDTFYLIKIMIRKIISLFNNKTKRG